MAPRPVANQRFRQRKLSTRHALQVIKGEKELETLDGDQQHTPKVETGVEKHEETEHHLQAAIASQAAAVGGNVAQVYIPTPETAQSSLPYAKMYQTKFSKPSTLIRFSSTVEDCCGTPYNMTDEDDVFVKEMNESLAQRKGPSPQCSDDLFEVVMNFFEETAKTQQPFSSVGEPPPILSFEDMQNAYDENIDELARTFAEDIFEHWRTQRTKNGNSPIQPGLKLKIMESATDADDNDPYVCFRRREVRQVRKTRGRDAQSVEKLKKLRRELEDARQLVALVRQREIAKKEQLAAERQLFEQRAILRQLKRNLPESYREGDEDLLVNQKPPKKKPLEVVTGPRTSISQPRPMLRPDGRSGDQDLVQLEDLRLQKERDIAREIATKKVQHQKWNESYVDWTNAPLTPPPAGVFGSGFRPAMTEYLPTPPASGSEDYPDAGAEHGVAVNKDTSVAVRYTTMGSESSTKNQPSFRRRVGRGGRMMIDRRGMRVQNKAELDPKILERFRFDTDDDDEMDDYESYPVDPFDINGMRYRAAIAGNSLLHTQAQTMKRAQIDQASTSGSQASTSASQAPSQPREPAAANP